MGEATWLLLGMRVPRDTCLCPCVLSSRNCVYRSDTVSNCRGGVF
jgi:hypothetical protein